MQRFERETTTTCGYCGVGCRLETHARDGKIASISPALDGPANKGHTCVKGRFAHQYTRSRDRLTTPLIREGDGFRIASWDEAIGKITREINRIKAEHGADAIAGLASSRATNEDCYAMQRMMRAAIGTNNIDNCSRVCHSPTSFALRRSFGLSGATGSFDDIEASGVLVIMGANPTQAHPVVGARMKQAALAGTKLITIDPRRIELADYGVLHLSPRPGTNAAVVLGMAHVVHRDGLADGSFIADRTEGYETFTELLAAYTPADVEAITGVPAADIERAAHIYAAADAASFSWGLGVTEHLYGSEVVQLICNLSMMTGNVGKPGAALLPLRGQNNVQGSSDMGALPDCYTAYRAVDDEEVARSFEERWGVSVPREKGYTIPQMFDAAVDGRLKAMYIFGEDVAQTDPDTAHVAARAREPRVPGLPGDLREHDDAVRGRHPARRVVPREDRDVHERRAAHPARQRRDRPARQRALRSRHPHDRLLSARPRDRVGVPRGRHGRGRRAHAALRRRHLRAARPHGPAVAGRGRRHRRADPLRERVRQARRSRRVRGPALQGAGRPRRRGVPADPRHGPPARALQRRHDDAAHRQRRAARLRLARDPPRRRRPARHRDRRHRLDQEPRGPDRAGGPDHRADRPGHVFTTFHFPEQRTNLLVGQSSDVNTSCPEYKVIAVDLQRIGVDHAPPLRTAHEHDHAESR